MDPGAEVFTKRSMKTHGNSQLLQGILDRLFAPGSGGKMSTFARLIALGESETGLVDLHGGSGSRVAARWSR